MDTPRRMDGPTLMWICYTRSMRILAVTFIVAAASFPALHAQQAAASIDLPEGAQVVLQARGDGVQIYTCTSKEGEAKWVLKAPDAKLLDASGKSIGNHFAGPTWKLDDGSQVQGELVTSSPSPEAGSVAWLKLRAKAGTATGMLGDVTLIRRTETHGGAAPTTGCATSQDAGKTVQVHYTATYTFYSGTAAR